MEEHLKVLLEKHFNGTASAEERLEVDRWINMSIQNQELYYEILEKYERDHLEVEVDLENDFDRLMSRIDTAEDEVNQTNKAHKVRTLHPIVKIAAAVTLLLGAYFIFKSTFTSLPDRSELMVRLSNPNGKRSMHLLPDSSMVWLNAGSKLAYSKDFNSDTRSVVLEGEAFFEVTKNPEKPFVVGTPEVTIRVLGTSFDVRSYQGERSVETVVLTGKVSVKPSKTDEVILRPNDRASYDLQSGEVTKSQVDAQSYVLWKDGVLRIEDITIEEMVSGLERWYGVSIDLSNKKGNDCRITGTFNNKSLEETLSYLQELISLEYQIKGREVRMITKSCGH